MVMVMMIIVNGDDDGKNEDSDEDEDEDDINGPYIYKSHLDVSVTKLRDGAIATSGASTGKRVRGTRCHLFVTIAISMIIMRSIVSKNIKFVGFSVCNKSVNL